jgi:pSer/pThr/pTyr-binding forkhead associated (FHA) protein
MERSARVRALQRRSAAEQDGDAFVLWQDVERVEQLYVLADPTREVSIGRSPACAIALPQDGEVSRLHASLQWLDVGWTVIDDGLSRNGTLVNGRRIVGRRRLADGDAVQCGATVLKFHDPSVLGDGSTTRRSPSTAGPVSPAQRRVLVELCRPFADGTDFVVPPGNTEVALALQIGVESVRTHVKALYRLFEIAPGPSGERRTALAEVAIRTGAVEPADFTTRRG